MKKKKEEEEFHLDHANIKTLVKTALKLDPYTSCFFSFVRIEVLIVLYNIKSGPDSSNITFKFSTILGIRYYPFAKPENKGEL